MDEEIYMKQNPETGVFEEVCRFTHYNPPKHNDKSLQHLDVLISYSEKHLRPEAKMIGSPKMPSWLACYAARKYQEQKDILEKHRSKIIES